MSVLGLKSVKDHLSEQEIMRLHRELTVPCAVHDVLKGLSPLDDTATYAMDVMIAEMPVDAALLCVSLSAAHIAHDLTGLHPMAGALAVETRRITHEYGPTWLAYADGQLNDDAVNAAQTQFTDSMAEDFEALADLLDTCGGDMPGDSDQAQLCTLLADHARSYAAYTNAMVNGEDLGIIYEDMDAHPAQYSPGIPSGQSNVIAFPGAPRPQ
ncbi:hypothetical protein [Micavibrio aeruginosavorus]|uniref:hypothetical protein n=1 Tax=Micavibrio aeruginosavorus TaxID=349221 RepID=UPI003F4A93EA